MNDLTHVSTLVKRRISEFSKFMINVLISMFTIYLYLFIYVLTKYLRDNNKTLER